MKLGKEDIITVQTLTTSETSGDTGETWDTGVQTRAKISQIDGSRYMTTEELVDKKVYEVEMWDNNWSNNVRIVYGTETLYPIRPIRKNKDKSNRVVVNLIVATKA